VPKPSPRLRVSVSPCLSSPSPRSATPLQSMILLGFSAILSATEALRIRYANCYGPGKSEIRKWKVESGNWWDERSNASVPLRFSAAPSPCLAISASPRRTSPPTFQGYRSCHKSCQGGPRSCQRTGAMKTRATPTAPDHLRPRSADCQSAVSQIMTATQFYGLLGFVSLPAESQSFWVASETI